MGDRSKIDRPSTRGRVATARHFRTAAVMAVVAMVASGCSLFTWGFNGFGSLGLGDVGSSISTPTAAFPQNNDWASISAGLDHSCGITNDGALWCWGDNTDGQLGIFSTEDTVRPVRASREYDWMAVDAGTDFTCGIRAPGTLWCWGENGAGQLGLGYTGGIVDNADQVGVFNDWTSVSAGGFHACAHRSAGTYCWGQNSAGQLGDGTMVDRDTPTFVDNTISDPVAGGAHSCGRVGFFSLSCWGENAFGQVGDGTNTDRSTPTAISLTGVGDFDLGSNHTCALADGGALTTTAYCWGWNVLGQLGDGTTVDRNSPTEVEFVYGAPFVLPTAIGLGNLHTCAHVPTLLGTSMECWGLNADGQLGDGSTTSSTEPVSVSGTFTGEWDGGLSVGGAHTCALRNGADLGEVNCWGDGFWGAIGSGATSDVLEPAPLSVAQWQRVTGDHDSELSCGVMSDLTLWCSGQLNPPTAGFAQVGTANDWVDVRLADAHRCGRRLSGSIWCWGSNGLGALGTGLGSPGSQDDPTQVGTDTDWSVVQAGGGRAGFGTAFDFTCGIRAPGTLWCWGDNSQGQMGIAAGPGPFFDPVQVGTDADWQSLDLGVSSGCAIKTDRTLWCWGTGILGDGSTASSVPVQVGSATNWKSVSVGGLYGDFGLGDELKGHTCGVRGAGTLWCWGNNEFGQLGLGTTADELTPVRVGIDSDWFDVSAGGLHACGRRSGAAWCWGWNNWGQLGDGTMTDSSVPVMVLGSTTWNGITAAGAHTLAWGN